MASQLSPDDLKKAYDDALNFMRPLHAPFNEYERIARNKPRENLPEHVPKTTDGTSSALVQDQPKRTIQQIPTGNFKIGGHKWLELTAKALLFNVLLKRDRNDADLLQLCWALMTKALTYGGQATITQYGLVNGRFMAYTTMPYIKDILLEPGKVTSFASDIPIITAWYTKRQLDDILERAKKDKANESGWDTTRLKEFIDTCAENEKSSEQATSDEREKNVQQSGFQLAHCLQRGIGANHYTFDPKTGNVLRTVKNKHPFGGLFLNFLHANVDFSNPLGRGAIEMSAGMQNFIDSILQSYQWMAGLKANPPIEVHGTNIQMHTIKMKNGAIWNLGSDPNASAKPVQLDGFIVQNMPQIYGLAKSQILMLNANNDTSISAEVGNPGFSKTDAGVDAQQARLGISDNYMRKQFEAWFAREAANLFYVQCLNAQSVEELTLSDDDAMRMVDIAPERLLDDGHTIIVNYDEIRSIIAGDDPVEVLFETSPSTSAMEDTTKQLEALTGLLEQTKADPYMRQTLNTKEIASRIVVKSGVEDPEKITTLDDEQSAMAASMLPGQPNMQGAQPMAGEQVTAQPVQPQPQEAQAVEQAETTPTAEQPQFTQQEIELASELMRINVPDELVKQAVVLLRQGMQLDEILTVIKNALEQNNG